MRIWSLFASCRCLRFALDTVRLVAGVALNLKSRAAFQMENLALRHQLGVLTVPTIRFQILYAILALAHDRRRILHLNITARPIAERTR
jgi:hypothetical protein